MGCDAEGSSKELDICPIQLQYRQHPLSLANETCYSVFEMSTKLLCFLQFEVLPLCFSMSSVVCSITSQYSSSSSMHWQQLRTSGIISLLSLIQSSSPGISCKEHQITSSADNGMSYILEESYLNLYGLHISFKSSASLLWWPTSLAVMTSVIVITSLFLPYTLMQTNIQSIVLKACVNMKLHRPLH